MPIKKKLFSSVKETPQNHKLTDKEFWTILRKNGGLFSRTARAIEEQYNVPFTRQAVSHRANKNPKELEDIREQNLDVAEEVLTGIMRTGKEHNRLEAAKFILKTVGRKRGYDEKIDLTSGGQSWAELMREFHEGKKQ